MKIRKYQLVIDDYPIIEEKVNAMIGAGWQPLGVPIMREYDAIGKGYRGIEYTQAMVVYENSEDTDKTAA